MSLARWFCVSAARVSLVEMTACETVAVVAVTVADNTFAKVCEPCVAVMNGLLLRPEVIKQHNDAHIMTS